VTAPFDLATLGHLLVATISGLAVGIEREWSGHATGPKARFAGIRTFTMLGLVCGLSGWLWTAGLQGPAVVMLGGVSALVVVAYLAASRRDVDGTTEVAAFVVMAAGVLAGSGFDRVASGITAVTVLLLLEKKQLHGLVSKLDLVELRAGARFAVMAGVVFPLLPSGPYGPWGGVRPRMLWALVLFFSGLSFLGYLARRTAGRNRGYAIAGTFGGMLSSTSVTLTLARLSRHQPDLGRALASGTMGANLVMFPRVLIATAVLAPALTRALWPAFVLPVVIGIVLLFRGVRDPDTKPSRESASTRPLEADRNPLEFFAAMQMAALFQFVLYAVWLATSWLGQRGLYGSAVLLGLVDVDGITISMAHFTNTGTAADVAARALTIGVLANTVVKLTITLAIGRGRFRTLAGAGLACMAAALAVAIYWR
jgi:uncharacterized membrane protein (DUF4010 family)